MTCHRELSLEAPNHLFRWSCDHYKVLCWLVIKITTGFINIATHWHERYWRGLAVDLGHRRSGVVEGAECGADLPPAFGTRVGGYSRWSLLPPAKPCNYLWCTFGKHRFYVQ